MSIGENLNRLYERIERTTDRCGRKREDIKLIVVTKNVSVEKILEVIKLGIKDIGENRIQEAVEKYPELINFNLSWHMVGHLQTNKTKKAVEIFNLIQSVDSVKVAKEINKQALNRNKVQDCLIEIKVSEEPTKFGLLPEDLDNFFETTKDLKNIRFLGLMAMAPYFDNPESARPYFQRARKLFEDIADRYKIWSVETGILSMGMSSDFEIAIEEGANMIRIGTAIFAG